jgi:hypothetical protein
MAVLPQQNWWLTNNASYNPTHKGKQILTKELALFRARQFFPFPSFLFFSADNLARKQHSKRQETTAYNT